MIICFRFLPVLDSDQVCIIVMEISKCVYKSIENMMYCNPYVLMDKV